MSEHYVINNYSVVEYYFLSVLIGVWCICCDTFAYRKSDGKCTIAKNDFSTTRVASGYYIRDKKIMAHCDATIKNADGLFAINKN